MGEIADRLEKVRTEIQRAAERVGRDPSEVTLVAVTKTVAVEKIVEALDAGITHIGENRVQEAEAKFPALDAFHVHRHLIGRLQTNKINKAIGLFDLIHSVDSVDLARAIDFRAERAGVTVDCLVQVNVSGELSKSGLCIASAVDEIQVIASLPRLRVRGLMTIAPRADDPEEARPVFRRLAQLSREVADLGLRGVSMDLLSMGMSGDFGVAIEEGSTMVRIGSAIFGARGNVTGCL